MSEYRMRVQCTDEATGLTGCYVAEVTENNRRKGVSPIFTDSTKLFAWMKENGWKLDEYVDHTFIPWRVSQNPYHAALDADNAWQAELETVFGKRAGDIRYRPEGRSTPRLAELYANFREAEDRRHALASTS